MEYRYTTVKMENPAIVMVKLNRLLGFFPSGISNSETSTAVVFVTALSVEQKTTLDVFMARSDIATIPINAGGTNYTFDDIDKIKTLSGLDCDIYPTATGAIIQFTKVLTTTEKNSIKNSLSSLLKLT